MVTSSVTELRSNLNACGSSHRIWLPVAAMLAGAGWGANQFTPLLLVYQRALGLGTGTLEAMFGVYALGLIPGLLLAGPASDAYGRRRVVIPAATVSLASSVSLIAGSHALAFLFLGRLLAGLTSGAVFSAGGAWLRELSIAEGDEQAAARRAAVAMTTGFALGPLVGGLLAQWAPLARTVAYLPHLVLMAGVLIALRSVPETVAAPRDRRPSFSMPGIRTPRFRAVVAPMAPWVFATPAIAFALLPSIVGAGRAAEGIALTATVCAVCALAGVAIQPLARRLDRRGSRAPAAGLLVAAVGLGLAAVTADTQDKWMLLPSAAVLGCAYGLCLVAGLTEVQRIAGQRALGGLTAGYYTLCYMGFAAPYLLALGAHVTTYPLLLTVTAALALVSAGLVVRPVPQAAAVAGGPERSALRPAQSAR